MLLCFVNVFFKVILKSRSFFNTFTETQSILIHAFKIVKEIIVLTS